MAIPSSSSIGEFTPNKATQVFISPVLIATVVMFLAVGVLTYLGFKGGSPNLLMLSIMVLVPLGIYLVNNLTHFFILVFAISSARVWLPWLPGGLSLDIFVRAALVLLLVAYGILNRKVRHPFSLYRAMTYFFLITVIATIIYRGTGMKELGSSLWGGADYISLLVAIGFLLVAPNTVVLSVKQWLIVFTVLALGPALAFLADLSFVVTGGKFYHLYYLFSPSANISKSAFMISGNEGGDWRLQNAAGVRLAFLAIVFYPWLWRSLSGKMLFLLMAALNLGLAALSGFRLSLVNVFLLLLMFFIFVNRRNWGRILLAVFLAAFGLIIFANMFAQYMPFPVQRVVSWVPFANISVLAAMDAGHSSAWRMDLWHEVWTKEVPRYWMFGKGIAFNPSHYIEIINPSHWDNINNFLVTGKYHNGPLSLLVFFGVAGLVSAFILHVSAFRRYNRLLFKHTWNNPVLRHLFSVMLILILNAMLLFWLVYGDASGTFTQILIYIAMLEMIIFSDKKLPAPDNNDSATGLARITASRKRALRLPI